MLRVRHKSVIDKRVVAGAVCGRNSRAHAIVSAYIKKNTERTSIMHLPGSAGPAVKPVGGIGDIRCRGAAAGCELVLPLGSAGA